MSFDWKNIVAQHGKPAAYTVVTIASMFLLMKFCGGNKVERDMDGKLDTFISKIDSNEQNRKSDAAEMKDDVKENLKVSKETKEKVEGVKKTVDDIQETVDRTWERIDCVLPECGENTKPNKKVVPDTTKVTPKPEKKPKPDNKPVVDNKPCDTVYIQTVIIKHDTVKTPVKPSVDQTRMGVVECRWEKVR